MIHFHNKSGGPHNVSFWADSIPAGAADALKAGMPDQMAPLEGPLLTEPNAIYRSTSPARRRASTSSTACRTSRWA